MDTISFDRGDASGWLSELVSLWHGFLRSPSTVASICPSTPSVCRAVTERPILRRASTVVELGAGTGAVTKHLLRVMPSTGRLFATDLVASFVDDLARFEDVRLRGLVSDGDDLSSLFEPFWVKGRVDAVVCGIPFSTMSHASSRRLMRDVSRLLRPGGQFVTYQLRDHVCRYADRTFGEATSSRVVWRSLPPLVVRTWTKSSDTAWLQMRNHAMPTNASRRAKSHVISRGSRIAH